MVTRIRSGSQVQGRYTSITIPVKESLRAQHFNDKRQINNSGTIIENYLIWNPL